MSCAALRPGFAWLLLLCLGRTLLPEAWLLAWHPHAHTTQEPAFAARRGPRTPLLLGSPHQHCHTEQFYGIPFTGFEEVVLTKPRQRASYAAWANATVPAGRPARTRRATLRGPPANIFLVARPLS